MNIVYTFDDGYFEVTTVSIVSLLENNRNEKINLYIIDCGIDKKNKNKLKDIVKAYSVSVFFVKAIDMEDKIPIKVDTLYWSFSVFLRLFLDELLPNLDRVLSVDGDMLIRGSLVETYNSDLKGNLCAACYDCLPTPKAAMGVDIKEEYFNAGFCLFDLAAMRRENIQQKFVNYIVSKNGKLPHLDQDVLNGVLNKRILVLPAEYNMMTPTLLFGGNCCEIFADNEPYYSYEEIEKAVANPIIIHYVGYKYIGRPWAQPCYHPYNKEWIDNYSKINFDDNKKLLRYKKKKYGLLREVVCFVWNVGYKNPLIRKLEFLHEKRKLKNRVKKYYKQ